MSCRRFHAVVFAGVCIGLVSAGEAGAQARPNGAATFGNYCATCHGTSAKGDGPLASALKIRPADLTQIAKRNGGTFPATQVARIIDGRSAMKGHGGGDMPIWGDAFGKSTADPTPVDQKIEGLVTYLESIQIKP